MRYYKFRTFNDFNVKSLAENTIYASELSCLNDPFEGRYCKDERVSLELQEQQRHFDTRISRRAVFSLCTSEDEEFVFGAIHLWAYYADNHKGFCIEYNDSINNMDDGSSFLKSDYVKYKPSLPDGPNGYCAKTDEEYLYEICGTKSDVWQGEHEYRLYFMKSGLKGIDSKSVSAIYLGCRMSPEHKSLMKELAEHKGIPCYELELSGTEYRLQIRQ